jgi:hypothetical protein
VKSFFLAKGGRKIFFSFLCRAASGKKKKEKAGTEMGGENERPPANDRFQVVD